MPNLLKVKLDETTNPWTVDVEQKDDANHVPRGSSSQTITWQLHGNAAAGDIAWVEWLIQPPSGVFGTPNISHNGNVLTISDLNDSVASTGDWPYQISVTLNHQTYYTPTDSDDGTTSNPTIKNK